MIKINTCHILPDEPLIVKGTEPQDLLDLKSDPHLPVVPLTDISYTLSASMAGQDLLVTGSAQIQIETQCARCLDTIRPVIKAEHLCILHENAQGKEIDISEDIREELLLSMPEYFHCSENCKGLCPHCGANLNHEKCKCPQKTEPEIPPENNPWSALDALK